MAELVKDQMLEDKVAKDEMVEDEVDLNRFYFLKDSAKFNRSIYYVLYALNVRVSKSFKKNVWVLNCVLKFSWTFLTYTKVCCFYFF